jgi:fermentation-respiration switch protein FrsA (DUF1100 family)
MKTPVLMLHGTADQEVPYSQTLEMAEAFQKSHKEYTAVTFKDAGHALTGKDEKGRTNDRCASCVRTSAALSTEESTVPLQRARAI